MSVDRFELGVSELCASWVAIGPPPSLPLSLPSSRKLLARLLQRRARRENQVFDFFKK